jgi:predicted nuclease of restriction endonuclease-like (RecB) superfamily
MTKPDNPLDAMAAPSDSQNGVDPALKKSTLDLTPMPPAKSTSTANYEGLVADLSRLLEDARRVSARAVNTVMTATYWEFGRRIVEFEQGGEKRAGYGEELIKRLADDLGRRFGRGFSYPNLSKFRQFYLAYPDKVILSTASRESPASILSTPSIESSEAGSRRGQSGGASTRSQQLATAFPLPWSHYVRLLSVKNDAARRFYEMEALRGGWSVRQLDRQIATVFYERTALSRDKTAMLTKGAKPRPEDRVSAEEEVKDPLVLEFLNLKDEYSESDLEEALLKHLEKFLLELGGDFAFVGRQRRLRIGDQWYRVDLLFFHRRLRALVIIDLKIGEFSHADAGQMHVYLNYAKEHWMREGENPPVGLILCSKPNDALARYALEGLPNKVLAREYRLRLPAEKKLAAEIEKTREQIEARTKTT